VPVLVLEPTKELTKQLEDVQRRAIQVIFGNIPYNEVRCARNIPSLAERRLELSRTFFQRIVRDNSNVLWYLLPAKRDLQLTARLRCAREYSTISARTNRCRIWTNSLAVISVRLYCIVYCALCVRGLCLCNPAKKVLNCLRSSSSAFSHRCY